MSITSTLLGIVAAALATGLSFYAVGALLDVSYRVIAAVVAAATSTAALVDLPLAIPTLVAVAALLLVDGAPRWVWVAAEDVELIDEAR